MMNKSSLGAERLVLRLLHDRKTRERLTEIHTHLFRHNLHQTNKILAHFVSVCGTLNKISYAGRIFSRIHHPNILLFNSMIKAHSLCGPFIESIYLFSDMRNRDIWPDQYTFAPLIKSCSNLRDLKHGESVHAEVLITGFASYSSIRIGIVELYTTCGKMEAARKVFDDMSHRDVIVWNMMIHGFCKNGDVEMGLHLFRQMKERSVVTWNSMIASLEKNGRDHEALELFQEMRANGFEPDDATVVTIMPVCARTGAIDIGKWLHSYTESSGLIQDFITVGNSVVNFYCKCGNLDIARKVFDTMPRKNMVSWNALISGHAFNGKGADGIELFQEMEKNGEHPNEATFVGVLTCCAHTGLVEKGRELFSSMNIDYQIEPKLEHYGCVVAILGRSGCIKEAYELIKAMPMKPNATLLGALFSACCNHGELELAEMQNVWLKRLLDLNL